MIYDVHTHLLADSRERDRDTLLRAAHNYEIKKLFVSGIYQCPNPTQEMADEMNLEVLQFKREYPSLVEGYVYVSPELPGALTALRRAMEDWKFVGLKLWLSTYCDDRHVFPLIEQMIEYKAPVLIHAFHKAVEQEAFESTGEHVARLARRYPEARLLMAHFGGNAYHGLPAIADCPNVWVDMCSSIYRSDALPYALELLGPDRILFGSDMPGSFLVNQGQVEELAEGEEIKEKIFFRNAQKLFAEVLEQ